MTHSNLPGPLSIGLAYIISYFVTTNEKTRYYLFFFADDKIIYNIPSNEADIFAIVSIITSILLLAHITSKNIIMSRMNEIIFFTFLFTTIIGITLSLFESQNWISIPGGIWISPHGISLESIESFYISLLFSGYAVMFTQISRQLDQIDPFSFRTRRERPIRRRSSRDLFRNPVSILPSNEISENPPTEPEPLPEPVPPEPEQSEETETEQTQPEQIEEKEKSRAEIVLERMKGEES